jgi:tetratricopeptide (TPR) repeat protein
LWWDRLGRVEFGLLGPVELRVEGRPVPLGGRLQRARLARAAGTRRQETEALVGVATVNRHLGGQAAEHARQALRLARAAGYRVLEGDAGTAMAEADLALGRLDRAAEHAERALAVHRETGHRLGEARTLRVLGDVLRLTEGDDAALPRWEAALAILDDAGAAPEADALRDLLRRRSGVATARR